MSSEAESSTERGARRFLSALRDVLFESTHQAPGPAQAVIVASASVAESDLALARSALRDGLSGSLGPGIREFALQVEALREVLPGPLERQRAALRVLSLKGVSSAALVLELERAVAALSEQGRAFADKLAARLNALDGQRARAEASFNEDTALTQQAISRLQAELEAQHARLDELARARDEQVADCEAQAADLLRKKLGFESALREAQAEYCQLKDQLSTEGR
jgi:hypothetical protein